MKTYSPRKQNAVRKSMSNGSLTKIILIVLVLVVVYPIYQITIGINKSLSNEKQTVFIDIEEGDTRDIVAAKLEETGVLKDSSLFIWYIRVYGKGGNIQAGKHALTTDMSIVEIVETLETVPSEDTVWVTIPEGIRYDEFADIFEEVFSVIPESKFSKDKFLQISESPHNGDLSDSAKTFLNEYLPQGETIEGFLYPDTYNISIDASAEEILSLLVETLKYRVGSGVLTKANSSDFSFYQVLNIASMLEREAFNVEEMGHISDIIQRRLNEGYFLGVDATSLYYLKDWKAELTFRELNDTNPYNTRKNLGLPPTPITNPGIDAINAVLDPTPNDYLYYLHDMQGQIHYAKSNSEHEQNKAKYL